MVSIYSVDPNKHIEKIAESLKKIDGIKPPVWSVIAKTGVHKERPPTQQDWWYIRSAAILRSIFKLGPIGVSKLRVKYGGRKRRGHKPEEFRTGSGSVIRKIMQQLEKSELIKKTEIGVHKGKVVTGKGKSILDKAAVQIMKTIKKEKPVVQEEPKKEQPKPAEKKEAPQKKEEKKEQPKKE